MSGLIGAMMGYFASSENIIFIVQIVGKCFQLRYNRK